MKFDSMIASDHTYALFFDIDGTLVSFKTHEIPLSTIQALTEAKANGSRVYIATGRPPLIITNLKAIEHLIDGYVTTNGALCYVGDELVGYQPIAQQAVMTCVEDAKAKGYSLIVIGRKDVAEENLQESDEGDDVEDEQPVKTSFWDVFVRKLKVLVEEE